MNMLSCLQPDKTGTSTKFDNGNCSLFHRLKMNVVKISHFRYFAKDFIRLMNRPTRIGELYDSHQCTPKANGEANVCGIVDWDI